MDEKTDNIPENEDDETDIEYDDDKDPDTLASELLPISGLRNFFTISMYDKHTFGYGEYNFLTEYCDELSDSIFLAQEDNCRFGMDLCQSEFPCETFIVFALDGATTGMDIKTVQKNIRKEKIKIVSACILYVKKYENIVFGELYSICTSNTDKKQNYLKDMLKCIQKLNCRIQFYWIGVSLTRPNFREKIELYTSIGFGSPKFNSSSYLNEPLYDKFVSLRFYPGEYESVQDEKTIYTEGPFKDLEIKFKPEKIKRNIKVAEMIYNIPNMKEVSVRYNISMNVLSWLKNRVDMYAYEYGGSLLIDGDVIYNMNVGEFDMNLVLYPQDANIGNEFLTEEDKKSTFAKPFLDFLKNPFSVHTGKTFAVFHTHPKATNISNSLFFNQPSCQDMKTCVRYWKECNSVLFFVAANEGIYSYQLSPKMLFLIMLAGIYGSNEWYDYVEELIYKHFVNLEKNCYDTKFTEKFRQAIVEGYYGVFWEPSREKKEFIQDFIKSSNNITLGDLCRENLIENSNEIACRDFSKSFGMDPNYVNVFITSFTPWEMMLRNQGLSGLVYYYEFNETFIDDNDGPNKGSYKLSYPPESDIPLNAMLEKQYIR